MTLNLLLNYPNHHPWETKLQALDMSAYLGSNVRKSAIIYILSDLQHATGSCLAMAQLFCLKDYVLLQK
jgi:hypothetical protein